MSHVRHLFQTFQRAIFSKSWHVKPTKIVMDTTMALHIIACFCTFFFNEENYWLLIVILLILKLTQSCVHLQFDKSCKKDLNWWRVKNWLYAGTHDDAISSHVYETKGFLSEPTTSATPTHTVTLGVIYSKTSRCMQMRSTLVITIINTRKKLINFFGSKNGMCLFRLNFPKANFHSGSNFLFSSLWKKFEW